jgi:hypothetical protein
VVLRKGKGADAARRYAAEKERYEQFFGKRKMDFHSGGVVDFVSSTPSPPQPKKLGNPRHRG